MRSRRGANGRGRWNRRRHSLATKPAPPRPQPRLYLATPEVDDPAGLIGSLPGLLAAADIAAVLLRLTPTHQPTMIASAHALAAVLPNSGAAPLVHGRGPPVAPGGAHRP